MVSEMKHVVDKEEDKERDVCRFRPKAYCKNSSPKAAMPSKFQRSYSTVQAAAILWPDGYIYSVEEEH